MENLNDNDSDRVAQLFTRLDKMYSQWKAQAITSDTPSNMRGLAWQGIVSRNEKLEHGFLLWSMLVKQILSDYNIPETDESSRPPTDYILSPQALDYFGQLDTHLVRNGF